MPAGTTGNSDVHLLTCSEYQVFQRTDVTTFLLRYDEKVGRVVALRLWHDNAGDDPSWSVLCVSRLN